MFSPSSRRYQNLNDFLNWNVKLTTQKIEPIKEGNLSLNYSRLEELILNLPFLLPLFQSAYQI